MFYPPEQTKPRFCNIVALTVQHLKHIHTSILILKVVISPLSSAKASRSKSADVKPSLVHWYFSNCNQIIEMSFPAMWYDGVLVQKLSHLKYFSFLFILLANIYYKTFKSFFSLMIPKITLSFLTMFFFGWKQKEQTFVMLCFANRWLTCIQNRWCSTHVSDVIHI